LQGHIRGRHIGSEAKLKKLSKKKTPQNAQDRQWVRFIDFDDPAGGPYDAPQGPLVSCIPGPLFRAPPHIKSWQRRWFCQTMTF